MTVSRKALKGAVKRGLLHKDAVDGPVPEGGPRRWTCLTCGREFRRDQDAHPRLFGCGCCSGAWDMFGLHHNIVAGKPAQLVASGVVGVVKAVKGDVAVFIAEGGEAQEYEAKALAPIYQYKTVHDEPCRHAPMPSGIPFQQKTITKETPMAVKKFVPKGKDAASGDVESRLISIFKTAGGTTAAQAVAQVTDLGISAESSVAQFLENPPAGYELQKRKGEGGATVYRLAQERPGAGSGGTLHTDEEETGMATKTVKKAANKKVAVAKVNGTKVTKVIKAVTKKSSNEKAGKKTGVIAAMRQVMVGKSCTKEEVVAAVAKLFLDRKPESMASTFSTNFAGKNPVQQKLKGHTVTQSKKDGVIYYQLKLAKTSS